MNTLWQPCFFVMLFLFMTGRAKKAGKLQSCHVAQLQCHARRGCQTALNNFYVHCHSLMKGQQKASCPMNCKHALLSLLSTEDQTGLAFINCDCRRESSCIERKKKVEICQIDVLESMHVLHEDSAPVTCNLAKSICEADTSCLAALQYYYDHCTRLFIGIKCTSKCRNSLDILSRQSHASKLRSCLCDGSEDYNCQALKVNTESLCLHRKRGRRQKNRMNSTDVIPKATAEYTNDRKQTPDQGSKQSRRRKRRNRPVTLKTTLRNTRRDSRKRRKWKKIFGDKIVHD